MARPIEIREGVHWVGSLDSELRVFDVVMKTDNGTSYNAYVIIGSEAVALIDTTKHGFEGDLLEKVRAVVDPARIRYLVVNHTEPDHSGAVAAVLDAAPEATVVGTRRALTFLEGMLHRDVPQKPVKAGDTLELGGKTLHFLPSPWLHWPDTMFTWLAEDGLLFSGDVFGAHHCDAEMFDDRVEGDLQADFKYYYDVIMGPFPGYVRKGLQKLSGLDVQVICPSHGPMRRKDPAAVMAAYHEWSAERDAERPLAILAYASAYGYTRSLADAIAQGLAACGVQVRSFDLQESALPEVLAAVHGADALVLGSPTFNGAPVPPVLELFAHLDLFRAKGKVFGAFGSYGWSGEAVGVLMARAKELRMRLPDEDGLKVVFRPREEDLRAARAYGEALGELVKG